jgi:hypothetical protein
MAERKKITTLWVVTDSETSYDNIGDIDGGAFDTEWLKQHIKSHGIEGLTQQLAFMSWQVFDMLRVVNGEKSQEVKSSVTEKPLSLPE